MKSCKILTPSFHAAHATSKMVSIDPTPIIKEARTVTQRGVPPVESGLGVVGIPGDRGARVDERVTGGRVGDWVPKAVPLVISGHKGTTEAPPVPYKYASQLHPMLKYLHFKNVPIRIIHKEK